MTRKLSSSHYRPDIDGLRAVAVISVIIFHAFPKLLPGGFVGVDIFFVISGFLISSIIFSNVEKGTFSYLDFYIRRVKRIFPALALVLFSVLAFGWVVLFSSEFKALGANVLAASTFLSNVQLWRQSGYFDADATHKPLLHLWSLGVEEQFYIFWPVFVGLAWHRWRLLSLTVVLGLLSFALSLYLTWAQPVSAFYLPFARFWELMIGGSLAYLRIHRKGEFVIFPQVQSIVGIMLIGIGVIFATSTIAFPGWLALLPTVGAFLLISAGPQAIVNRHVLSNPAMVAIGLISYPLYMWHWPLLSFLRVMQGGDLPPVKAALALGLALVLAWLTYRLIEIPIRKSSNGSAIAIFLACAVGLAGLSGMAIWKLRGLPSRAINRLNPSDNKVGDIAADVVDSCDLPPQVKRTISSCFSDKREPPVYALLGDSKAAALFPGLVTVSKAGERWMIIGGNGDYGAPVPVISNAARYRSFQTLATAASDAIVRDPRIRVVVLTVAVHNLFSTHDRFLEDLSKAPDYQIALEGLDRMILKLTAGGKQVVLTLDNPTLADPEWCMSRTTSFPLLNRIFAHPPLSQCSITLPVLRERTRLYLTLINALEAKWHGHLEVYDPSGVLCDQQSGICPMTMDGHLLYSYTDHVSDFGSILMARALIPIVEQSGARKP